MDIFYFSGINSQNIRTLLSFHLMTLETINYCVKSQKFDLTPFNGWYNVNVLYLMGVNTPHDPYTHT